MFGLDRVAMQLLGVVLLVGLLLAGYYWWKNSIEKEALQEWNKKQIELVQQQNQKVVEDLKKLNEDAEVLNKELEDKNQQLQRKLDSLKKHVRSPEVRKHYQNKPSSEILKRTVKELAR